MLPGLFRFGGALRRDRPDRVSCSTVSSAFGSEVGTESGTGSSTGVCSGSLSLPLPFARDLRCDFGLDGLCLGVVSGTKSSIGSGTGRGLAAGVPERLVDFFHKLLADVGVPMALCGDRGLSGVENDCLACVTSGCIGGTPGLPVPGVWTFDLVPGGCCRLLTGVDTWGWWGVVFD